MQFLCSFFPVISKGYHVKGYIIHWEGREIYRFRETIHIETLLIPDWLPSENRGSIWIVVKHMTKIVIVYVGKEVTGPKIKSCGDDDDPYDDSEDRLYFLITFSFVLSIWDQLF